MKKRILRDKELRIAKLLVSGMSAKMIARALGLSIRTVEHYQKTIKQKLGCKNTYQTGYEISQLLTDADRIEFFNYEFLKIVKPERKKR